ncbi:hypothetical protein BDQ17DRAFT_1335476 [Cyathus striatus]|nr:hypothetical protein BDQ17DRAFT_1335476 [Cyathus striatus]
MLQWPSLRTSRPTELVLYIGVGDLGIRLCCLKLESPMCHAQDPPPPTTHYNAPQIHCEAGGNTLPEDLIDVDDLASRPSLSRIGRENTLAPDGVSGLGRSQSISLRSEFLSAIGDWAGKMPSESKGKERVVEDGRFRERGGRVVDIPTDKDSDTEGPGRGRWQHRTGRIDANFASGWEDAIFVKEERVMESWVFSLAGFIIFEHKSSVFSDGLSQFPPTVIMQYIRSRRILILWLVKSKETGLFKSLKS